MKTVNKFQLFEGLYGMSNRMGRIPDFHLFDGDYFGIMGQMVEMLDPQVRLIIESTHEAIIDAGIYNKNN